MIACNPVVVARRWLFQWRAASRLLSSSGGGGGSVGVTIERSGTQKSFMDIEREIAQLKQEARELYRMGKFGDGLELALGCKGIVEGHFGREHPVFASSLNDIALFHKMMGEHEQAVEAYREAPTVYKDIVGEDHPSFATTLHNLGLLFKSMADISSGLEKQVMLDRAAENLELALQTRKTVLDNDNPDIANSMQSLATVYRQMTGTAQNAEKAKSLLNESVELLRRSVGSEHSATATALNNLGLLHKVQGSFDEALAAYQEAFDVRKKLLAEGHPDTITVMHNMAELYDAMSKESEAQRLRNEILDLLDPAATGQQNRE